MLRYGGYQDSCDLYGKGLCKGIVYLYAVYLHIIPHHLNVNLDSLQTEMDNWVSLTKLVKNWLMCL